MVTYENRAAPLGRQRSRRPDLNSYSHQKPLQGLGSSYGGNGLCQSNSSEKNAVKISSLFLQLKMQYILIIKNFKTQKEQIKNSYDFSIYILVYTFWSFLHFCVYVYVCTLFTQVIVYIIIYFFAFDVNVVSIDRVTISVLHLASPDITRARIGPVPGGTEELRFYSPWLAPVLSQV